MRDIYSLDIFFLHRTLKITNKVKTDDIADVISKDIVLCFMFYFCLGVDLVSSPNKQTNKQQIKL